MLILSSSSNEISGHSYFSQRNIFGIQLTLSCLNISFHRTMFSFSTEIMTLKVKVKVKSLSRVPLFPTPWTVAYQAPASHGIFQARVLEWIAIAFYRGSSRCANMLLLSVLTLGHVVHESWIFSGYPYPKTIQAKYKKASMLPSPSPCGSLHNRPMH